VRSGGRIALLTHTFVSFGTSRFPLVDCPRNVMHDGPLLLSCRHQYDSGSSDMFITIVTSPKKTGLVNCKRHLSCDMRRARCEPGHAVLNHRLVLQRQGEDDRRGQGSD
jgi:hypothetical protein